MEGTGVRGWVVFRLLNDIGVLPAGVSGTGGGASFVHA